MTKIDIEFSDETIDATMDLLAEDPEIGDDDLARRVLSLTPNLHTTLGDALRDAVVPYMR